MRQDKERRGQDGFNRPRQYWVARLSGSQTDWYPLISVSVQPVFSSVVVFAGRRSGPCRPPSRTHRVACLEHYC